jgi:hypothetical protein
VLGFGVKAAAAPLGNAAPATFGQTPVSTTATKDVSVTAATNVTVSGVSASSGTSTDPFTVGQVTETVTGGNSNIPVPVTFPVTLSKGDTLHAPVTFGPAMPGGTLGALSFTTPSGPVPSVSVPLSGDGTQTGLYATPSSQSFALVSAAGTTNVPVGLSDPRTIEITNGGTSAEAVTSVAPPAAPFTATGLPAPGTIINPGQSVTVQVTFAPQRAGNAVGSLTVSGNSGTSATVDLSGTGLAAVSKFTASPTAVNFGSVRSGHRAREVIDVANTGNQPATVISVAPLHAPFRAPYTVARGLPVNPGEDLRIPVIFTPTRNGTVTGVYRLTWTDRFGPHTLDVSLTGAGAR